MNFLRMRNRLINRRGWNRRVATLAARLHPGVDTWAGIEATPAFLGRPLLSQAEARDIRDFWLRRIEEERRVAPGETEEVAPSDTGAGGGTHPIFNIKGTLSGRFSCTSITTTET